MTELTVDKRDAELVSKLRDYCEEKGSQSAVAKMIGYSAAVVSQYLQNKYHGNIELFESALKELFANIEASREIESIKIDAGYVPTSVSVGVYGTIRMCHLKGGFAMECGEAGIGKTMACKKYAEDYPNTAIYISINPCLNNITAVLKLLCRKLGLSYGRKDDMFLNICDALYGDRKVIIIDEAQHLTIKTLEAIRALFDVQENVGVCLVGNIGINETINKTVGNYAQICNRMKLRNIRSTKDINTDDIKLLFPAVQNDKKAVELLLRVARTDQAVRGAQNLYSNALDNNNITAQGLIEMAKYMHVNGGY